MNRYASSSVAAISNRYQVSMAGATSVATAVAVDPSTTTRLNSSSADSSYSTLTLFTPRPAALAASNRPKLNSTSAMAGNRTMAPTYTNSSESASPSDGSLRMIASTLDRESDPSSSAAGVVGPVLSEMTPGCPLTVAAVETKSTSESAAPATSVTIQDPRSPIPSIASSPDLPAMKSSLRMTYLRRLATASNGGDANTFGVLAMILYLLSF